MRFASGISDAMTAREAADAACAQAREQLGGRACDLAFLFVSPAYRTAWPNLLAAVHERLRPRALIGCSGSGVIGGTQELEWVPAVSVLAASLPGVRLFPFAVSPEELAEALPGGYWVDKIGASPDAGAVFVLLADPLTCQLPALLGALNATYRGRPMTGGLLSGGTEPGDHVLFVNGSVQREGAVGIALSGDIAMEAVVSQGCRPVGRPYVVTKAEEQGLLELGGRQALAVLHEILSSLSPDDRELAQRGSIFAGVAMSEMRQRFESGDFLIRNIVGIDPELGALAISEPVDTGRTIQFQLRDPATSRQELRRLLQQRLTPYLMPPAGCLLFNCLGRGKSFYGTSHQDVRLIQTLSGKIPVGGLFCDGEIGPAKGTNFLHSYTASLALFRPVASPRLHAQATVSRQETQAPGTT
jgi:small ligand-binding sensory domain FIST